MRNASLKRAMVSPAPMAITAQNAGGSVSAARTLQRRSFGADFSAGSFTPSHSTSTAKAAGMTAAHHAAMDGRADCLRLLIEAGVDIEALDLGRRSPLDIAASRGHDEAEGVIRAALLVKIEREALLAVTRPAPQSAPMPRASRVGEWMARLARFAKNGFAALGPAPMPLLAPEPEAAHTQAGQPASAMKSSPRRL